MNISGLRARATVVRTLRAALGDEGFIEVQPPLLVGGPALEENLEALAVGARFLHTSPEFALKRVLAAGLPRIYSLVPCFRAEEVGAHHAEEFTMLELYRVNANYLDLIPLVEGLVSAAAAALGGVVPASERCTVTELFDGQVPATDDDFYRRWVEEIDPVLAVRSAARPVWVLDYPARQAALAEVRGTVSERLELYLGGLELGNGFSELRDGAELRKRFEDSAHKRRAAGKTPHPVDEGVIAASDRFPRAAGIAIGVERLVMALTGLRHIRDVSVGAVLD